MSKRCRICGSSDTSQWKRRNIGRRLEPTDLAITDSRYGVTLSLRKCSDCGFIFADDDELGELTSLYERLLDPGYERSQDTRLLQMRWLLDRALGDCPSAATLLDIGAGTGLLVKEAKSRSIDAVGVEPSAALVECARTANNVDLIQGVYPDSSINGRKFDLVFLVDVIEHVADPVEMLRDGGSALTPGGLLVVVTPDVSSFAASALGRRWWHFRLAHVGYFSRKSFERAARAAELVPKRWFRAKRFFRVSYLAERTVEYLPVTGLNRLALRFPPLRWCYDRVIPVNLHDSFVVFLQRRADGGGS